VPESRRDRKPVELRLPIRNVNRTVGTTSGITSPSGGAAGLPDDTIRVHFTGSAGQSFGAFVPRGVTFPSRATPNDYWGKGLSAASPLRSTRPREHVVRRTISSSATVALYGATSGEAYVHGVARRALLRPQQRRPRVVEGVRRSRLRDMTGGRVVVLGQPVETSLPGMSGGVAYVLDRDGDFKRRCHLGMVDSSASTSRRRSGWSVT